MIFLFQRWDMWSFPGGYVFLFFFLGLQASCFFSSVHARESAIYQWLSRCRGSEPFCEHCQGWLGVSLDGQLFAYWIVWGKQLQVITFLWVPTYFVVVVVVSFFFQICIRIYTRKQIETYTYKRISQVSGILFLFLQVSRWMDWSWIQFVSWLFWHVCAFVYNLQ